jgi:hypothetical protein
MEGYAYSRNGIMYGVETTETAIPQSYLDEIDFNYRQDGNGIITYRGNFYVYMPDGTFHKMIAVEHEGAKIPKENGFIESETKPYIDTSYPHKDVLINGVSYKVSSGGVKIFTDEEIVSFGFEIIGEPKHYYFKYTADPTFTGTKIMFYNGRYYLIEIKDGILSYTYSLERD